MLIELLPGWVLQSLSAIGLLIVGYIVERHYVSRVTCFTNALALNVYVLGLSNPSRLLTLYTDLGVIFGVIGLAAYADRATLGDWYYLPAFFLYASLPVGAVILLPTPFLSTLIVAGIANYLAGVAVNESGRRVIYDGALPGSVSRFLDDHQLDYARRRDGEYLLLRL